MNLSVACIIRDRVPEVEQLVPGAVVLTPALTFRSPYFAGSRFVCCKTDQHDMTFLVPRHLLLPASEYLRRQPTEDFRTLAKRSSLIKGLTKAYVSDPVLCAFGDRPFRFESLGEVRYFVDRYRCNMPEFFLSHTQTLSKACFE